MRGIWHRASAIETFLEAHPVPYPTRIDDLVYFSGKATGVFYDLLRAGPGRPPTCHEFQQAYMAQQPNATALRQRQGCWGRMAKQYIGLMRDYHAGALLVETPGIDHLFWDPRLDADAGVDYVVCSRKRYAAIHIRLAHDPQGWIEVKQRRKSEMNSLFPCHLDFCAAYQKHTKGNIHLCHPEDAHALQLSIMQLGTTRAADSRVWVTLGLQPLTLSDELQSLMHAKQEELDL